MCAEQDRQNIILKLLARRPALLRTHTASCASRRHTYISRVSVLYTSRFTSRRVCCSGSRSRSTCGFFVGSACRRDESYRGGRICRQGTCVGAVPSTKITCSHLLHTAVVTGISCSVGEAAVLAPFRLTPIRVVLATILVCELPVIALVTANIHHPPTLFVCADCA